MGMAWFDMDTIPDNARRSLGLPLRGEQASFESALGRVAQNAALQAEASLGNDARQKQWQDEAVASLAGPVHKVTFVGTDGDSVTEDSSNLTPEETALYTTQYVEQQADTWSNSPTSPNYLMMLNEQWLEHVFRRALREERRQEETARALNGPDHEVTFIGPDGKPVTKHSSHLTAEERNLYTKQYAAQQRAIERENRPIPVSARQSAIPNQQPAAGQGATSRQRNTASQQQEHPPRQQAPAPAGANVDALRREARAGNKSAQAKLKAMGLGW